MKPFCHMLIGVPGVGKTTFAKLKFPYLQRVSTDDYIETSANIFSTTYDEMFKSVIKHATKAMNKHVEDLVKMKVDFVWDQTNLTVESRQHKIKKLKDGGYELAAYFFTIPFDHKRRLIRPGKSIPYEIISNMIINFKQPLLAEGFNSVRVVDSDRLTG